MVSAGIEHLAANNLLSANPKLASQWHPTLNSKLTAKDVTLRSRKEVWWLCPKGHEWRAIITRRSYGSGCPYCTGQAICDDNCLATLNLLPRMASSLRVMLPCTPERMSGGYAQKGMCGRLVLTAEVGGSAALTVPDTLYAMTIV